jgi:hypothetical protein
MTHFASKHAAATYCKQTLGHSVHYDSGQSGDGGWGSREYFKAPDAPLNEYGFPVDKCSTISRVGRFWHVSDFSKAKVAA